MEKFSKDFLGNEVHIGDYVVFSKSYGGYLSVGRVINITAKGNITISYDGIKTTRPPKKVHLTRMSYERR
jgi:hypothetical protein